MSDTPATVKERTFEGDFDVEKAQRLIHNLDSEIANLKGDLTEARSQVDEFRTAADKSGTEQADALKAATERAEKAERALAIKKHNLPDDVVDEFADYLTGSADEVDARAAKLAARLGITDAAEKTPDAPETPAAPAGDKPADPPVVPTRPKTNLIPGQGGDTPAPFDAAAIAARVRR